MNEIQRMRQLAGLPPILSEGIGYNPLPEDESEMQTQGTIGRDSADAEFDLSQGMATESVDQDDYDTYLSLYDDFINRAFSEDESMSKVEAHMYDKGYDRVEISQVHDYIMNERGEDYDNEYHGDYYDNNDDTFEGAKMAEGASDSIDELKQRAQDESEDGYVVHVNVDPDTGHAYTSDWFDDDETVASFARGKCIYDRKDFNEGAKVDRMVGHIANSEKKLGKSDKEAENIAWATANKRGYLDNKNKKVHEDGEPDEMEQWLDQRYALEQEAKKLSKTGSFIFVNEDPETGELHISKDYSKEHTISAWLYGRDIDDIRNIPPDLVKARTLGLTSPDQDNSVEVKEKGGIEVHDVDEIDYDQIPEPGGIEVDDVEEIDYADFPSPGGDEFEEAASKKSARSSDINPLEINKMASLPREAAKAKAVEIIAASTTSDDKKRYLVNQVGKARDTMAVVKLLYDMVLKGEGLGVAGSSYSKRFDRKMKEDLQNGYNDVDYACGDDYFPDGADSPVVDKTGAAGARHGDNPEQKKMAVTELHRELVYGYRSFLKESKKKV